MGEIEGYDIPALHCQSDQAVLPSDILSAMHRETGLSPPCPAVACTPNNYHLAHPLTSTIRVPLLEAEFLLHLPDFYHELGHLLHEGLDHDVRYGPIREGVADAIRAVDRHYLQQTGGTTSALEPELAAWIRAQWAYHWTVESFCDLFALSAAGRQAYAYSHLHLVSKTDTDMYQLALLRRQDHPSDDARMGLLDAGMRMLGYEAACVRREWDAVARPAAARRGQSTAWHFRPPCSRRLPRPCRRRLGGRG